MKMGLNEQTIIYSNSKIDIIFSFRFIAKIND